MSANPNQGRLELKREESLPVVAVSKVEKARFKRVAEFRHMTMAELIRQLLHAEADKIEKGKAA